ncbi:MAG: CopG family transcriptional regulator [Deltaproteobacteria bacterium]|nr:CopG family transcriptional regulator [Deltaproteobacteria bacterium]
MSDAPHGKRPRVTLKIPAELYDKLKQLIADTGFASVTEFAVYVLRDVAAGGKLDHESHGLSGKEVEAVRQRLRALGYIE